MRRAAALLVVAVLVTTAVMAVVLGTAAPASAHATLVSSDPAEGEVLDTTPDVVTFTFDEPVSLPPGAVQVFDATGEPVDSDSSSRDDVITTDLPETLDDGSYVVVWRAISADGHPIAGSLTFAIGAPSAEVAPPKIPDTDPADVRRALSVSQGLSYVGLLVASGLVLFLAWTARGVRLDDAVRGRVLRVAWSATGVALVAGVAGIPLTGAYQQGLGLEQLGESAAVDLGLVGDDLVVLALQAIGLLVGLALVSRGSSSGSGSQSAPWWVPVAGAAVAALSPAAIGHSRAIEPVWLLVATDLLHLAAGATWLGGLVGLALTLKALSGREKDAALVLSRFSVLAASLLGVLAVTGSLMGWRILEGWAPLLDTTYGRLLLVKVGIAVVVAAVAGFNRFRLLPGAVDGVGHGNRQRSVLRVRTAVRVEAGLLVALLGVTGFLTNQSPREGPTNRAPVASQVEVGVLDEEAEAGVGAKALVTMSPRTTGPVTVTVQLQDQSGEPVDGLAAPTVSIQAADGSLDLGTQPVVPSAAGTYVVEAVIPTPGTWEVQVGLQLSDFDNPVTVVSFEVS